MNGGAVALSGLKRNRGADHRPPEVSVRLALASGVTLFMFVTVAGGSSYKRGATDVDQAPRGRGGIALQQTLHTR